jgi:hypothetical protein
VGVGVVVVQQRKGLTGKLPFPLRALVAEEILGGLLALIAAPRRGLKLKRKVPGSHLFHPGFVSTGRI